MSESIEIFTLLTPFWCSFLAKFGREITYLRLSVTEHCNYRCFYCRDDEHVPNCKREDILSYEDIERIVQIFAELGVTKVRLTGGHHSHHALPPYLF
jgi:molybdenum cofactor biosynthesis enzyme MoaA